MNPLYCQQCGRANGQKATRCLWCGVPISSSASPRSIEATRVELEYLDGIERLDNPTPVRLIVGADGIEVSELMPGSRTIRIAADSIIGASVVDASTTEEGKRGRAKWWWWLTVGPLALAVPGRKGPDTKKHDYLLTIKYRAGGDIRNAVFHRQDRIGLSIVEGLARIITMLVQASERRPGRE